MDVIQTSDISLWHIVELAPMYPSFGTGALEWVHHRILGHRRNSLWNNTVGDLGAHGGPGVAPLRLRPSSVCTFL